MMKRREFMSMLGCAATVWPLTARAQQPSRVRRIGVLVNLAADDSETQARVGAFLQGCRVLAGRSGAMRGSNTAGRLMLIASENTQWKLPRLRQT